MAGFDVTGVDVVSSPNYPYNLRVESALDTDLSGFAQATNRKNLRRTVEVGVWRIPLLTPQVAMGIGWMTLPELSQSIPPAYARHIGLAAMTHITLGGGR